MPDETDVSQVAVFIDVHHEMPAFLRAEPWWAGTGVHGFRPPLDDPAVPTTWVFCKGAQRAFEAWQRTRGLPT